MSQWKTKPKIVEAFFWTGGPDQTEDPEWIVEAIKNGDVVFRNKGTPEVEMRITDIFEKWHYVKPGTWIVQEPVLNRFYPCLDEVFRASYEPV